MITASELIDYWYAEDTRKLWFKPSDEFDQKLTTKFAHPWQQALDGQHDFWMNNASGCLALCILLDQIPRNIFRGRAKAFASDEKAVAVCKHTIKSGLYSSLSMDHSRFLYMPLMHSEVLSDQDLAISMFAEVGLAKQARFAQRHRGIIEEFGRFPHRNKILRRVSSAAEERYLQSKSAFTG